LRNLHQTRLRLSWGTVIDPEMGDELKVTVVATGLGAFLEHGGKKPVTVVDNTRLVNPVTEYAKFDKPAFIRGNAQKGGLVQGNAALDRRALDEKRR
jgi:cell division GTPase FtsZ